MIEGLKAAAQIARDWAQFCRGQILRSKGDPVRMEEIARAYEAIARTYDAKADQENTPTQGVLVWDGRDMVRFDGG